MTFTLQYPYGEALKAQWCLAIFKNIAASEQTHPTAVLTLLERVPEPRSF